MSVVLLHDPGTGDSNAPVGTEAWALRVRLSITTTVADLPKAPERFNRYYNLITEHRAWRLMTKADGTTFSSWTEFCAYRQPWGLGKPWEEIRPFLVAVLGENAVALATVRPDGRAESLAARRGEDGRAMSIPATVTGMVNDDRTERNLRAIAERAPEPAKELYRAGLLGQQVAAKLGPKNPPPEVEARVTEIAQTLASEARELDTSTKAAREAAKRALNAKARGLLGVRQDRVSEAMRIIERMDTDERERLMDAVRVRWPEVVA